MKERNYCIDIIKFLAVIFITNSHYIPLYKDINIAFATLGVHGNALFFFISGFTITLSNNINLPFKDWYKRRIQRIWPTFIVWPLLANLIFNKYITWENSLIAKGYWFIQCIMISYIVLYYILLHKKSIKLYILFSILITGICLGCMEKSTGSIFHSNLHYICYFPSMLLGLYLGTKRENIRINYLLIKTIGSFLAYFLIMKIGKGQTNALYYLQIIAIFPLNIFIYYLYYWLTSIQLNKIKEKKWLWYPIYWIGSLSLEIYVVQFSVITDRYNNLFPLNTIIIFIQILIVAYILRICSNFFTQTFSNESYSLKKALKI